jgi:hypothetical protein
MEAISKHISWNEATQSPTATRLGIKNIPNKEELQSMKEVAEMVFEPMRNWYGKPIKINSFFRNEALNRAVKGAKTSQHRFGEAIDFDAGKDNLKLALWIMENVVFDQIILEGIDAQKNIAWVHVSYDINRNRKQALIMKNGKYYDFHTNKSMVM